MLMWGIIAFARCPPYVFQEMLVWLTALVFFLLIWGAGIENSPTLRRMSKLLNDKLVDNHWFVLGAFALIALYKMIRVVLENYVLDDGTPQPWSFGLCAVLSTVFCVSLGTWVALLVLRCPVLGAAPHGGARHEHRGSRFEVHGQDD